MWEANTIPEKTKKPLKSRRRKRRTKAEKARIWREYKEARQRATPPWANLEEIEKIYESCRAINKKSRTKYQVDHIIPLRGKTVCGLHVETNLQIISKKENRKKSNRFDPDNV